MNDTRDLNLWYEEQLVGHLWNNDLDRIGFRYSADWLANKNKFAVSLKLPLRHEDFPADEGTAHRFFANLLPEAQARQHIISDLKISDSDYSLLGAIGGECAGAFNILPASAQPEPRTAWSYTMLPDNELKALIRRKGNGINFRNNSNQPIRLSLAGAQNKFPIFIRDNLSYLPSNEAPTSHILKFQLADYKHVPAFETILMKLAQAIGMDVANIELRALEGMPASKPNASFAEIQRYDRTIDATGNIIRLHQEDFCQALGFGYNKKYQADGGPSFSDCITLVRDHSTEPAADSLALLNWQLFNFLAGNSDGHAKNLSLLYRKDNSIRLAPFYDLVCTRAIKGISADLAFPIGGERNPDKVLRKNWEAFAKETDINLRFLISTTEAAIEKILDCLPKVMQEFGNKYGDYSALQQVEQFIRRQCRAASRNLR